MYVNMWTCNRKKYSKVIRDKWPTTRQKKNSLNTFKIFLQILAILNVQNLSILEKASWLY